MQKGVTESTENPSSGKLNAEARAFIPTVPSVSITGYPPPYSFVAPTFGMIPPYAPMPAEKRGLDPNAPEFIPTSAPRPPVVALTQPSKDVVCPPQFVEKGGFRPQVLEKRPQQPNQTPSQPQTQPPTQPSQHQRAGAKSYASVAKVAPIAEPAPEPKEPAYVASDEGKPPQSIESGETESKVPATPSAKTKQGRTTSVKTSSKRPKPSKRRPDDNDAQRVPRSEVSTADSVQKRAPKTQPPVETAPRAEPSPAPQTEPVSPTRIAAKGVWGRGNSKSLFQVGQQKVLPAEKEPPVPMLVKETEAPIVVDASPSTIGDVVVKPVPVKEERTPTAVEAYTSTTGEAAMKQVPVKEEETPIAVDASTSTTGDAAIKPVAEKEEEAPVAVDASTSPTGDAAMKPVAAKEEEAPIAVDASTSTTGDAAMTAPALSLATPNMAELKSSTPVVLSDRTGAAPLHYKDFKDARLSSAWGTQPRMAHLGVNAMFDNWHNSQRLNALDNEAAAVVTPGTAVSAVPEEEPTPEPSVEDACELNNTVTSSGKMRYTVEDMLAVRSHKACTKITKELRDSPYIQSVLKRDGIAGLGPRSGLDIESLYRNKPTSSSTSINRANFSMPSSLRSTNIFESSEHIWSSKGGRPMSRDPRPIVPVSTEDWSRAASGPAKPAPPAVPAGPPPPLPENSWQVKQQEQKSEGDRSIKLLRRLRAQLNKMTPATCETIYEAILGIGIETFEEAEKFVNLIFEKAITNHQYIQMYAEVCGRLQQDLSKKGVFDQESTKPVDADGEPEKGSAKMDFRRLLLQCCQTAFTENLKQDFVPPEGADDEETFEALVKHKHKMKGNLMFVGTLAQLHLISYSVITMCAGELLKSRQSLQLEALAAFLPGVKSQLTQVNKVKDAFASLFEEIRTLSEDPTIEHRIQCLLKDVIEDKNAPDARAALASRAPGPRMTTSDGFTSAASTRSRFRK